MAETIYRCAVVDDDPSVRKATIRAFAEERFSCDAAGSGAEAKQMLAANRYDVVVTDLQMPNGHGHALAMEILALEDRPAIAILTGMLDPRLAKDLVGAGSGLCRVQARALRSVDCQDQGHGRQTARHPDGLRGAPDFLEA